MGRRHRGRIPHTGSRDGSGFGSAAVAAHSVGNSNTPSRVVAYFCAAVGGDITAVGACESDWRWFNPFDRVDAVDGPVERGYLADPGALGACDQVCLREVNPVSLVDLDRTQKKCRVNADNGVECDERSHRFGNLAAGRLVKGLQHVHRLSRDEVCQQ